MMDGINGDLGAMVEKLMKDPQAAALVSRLKEGTEADPDREDPEKAGKASEGGSEPLDGVLEKLGTILGAGNGTHKGGSAETENRNRLFAALKPYVNRERRDMIDKVASISSLTSLIEPILKGSGK